VLKIYNTKRKNNQNNSEYYDSVTLKTKRKQQAIKQDIEHNTRT